MALKPRRLKKFVIFLTILYYFSSNCTFANPVDIKTNFAKHGYKILMKIKELKNILDKDVWQDKMTKPSFEIFNPIYEIRESLPTENYSMNKESPNEYDLNILNNFEKDIHLINHEYHKNFIEYFVMDENYDNGTIQDFIHGVIGEAGLRSVLSSLSTSIILLRNRNIFDTLLKYQRRQIEYRKNCDAASSHNQQLYAVYNRIIHTLIQGYIMIIYSYQYCHFERNTNGWNILRDDAMNEYKRLVLDIAPIALRAMNKASYEIRRCDPDNFLEGVNYIRLKHFLSAIITTQTSMSRHTSCSGSCSDYKELNKIQTSVTDYDEFQCHGPAYDCWKTSVAQICLGARRSERRYEALTERNGLFDLYRNYHKGNWSDRCQREKVSSSILTWNPFCSTCACICDEVKNPHTLRTFSLRLHYTDFRNGKVVTGVRIKATSNLIDLEIQEGKLINGEIDPSTIRWNPDANYAPRTGPETLRLDYHTRSLNLDDIMLPAGFAVTGVRFASINGVLSLVVAGVQIFDKSGEVVVPKQMKWYWPNKSNRTKIELNSVHIPTGEKKDNIESSQPGKQFINFGLTGWSEDASQTVVPYIDTQEVITNPLAPIGGVGIFFKNYDKSGGFISLKLFSVNYTIYLDKDDLSSFFQKYNKNNIQ